jgi:hypothetical protein
MIIDVKGLCEVANLLKMGAIQMIFFTHIEARPDLDGSRLIKGGFFSV